ncbi:MAG: tetratricopeptide repeat protein [bacterium]|nr:tetratricopeptide repeat protein [bacterium]
MRWMLFAAGTVVLAGCAFGPELPEIPERATLKLDIAVDRVYGQLADNPMDPEANGTVARVLHRLGQYPEAELLYRRAHALDTGSPEWLYLMGHVQGLQQHYVAAVGSLRQALVNDPSYVPARLAMAEFHFRSGELIQSATEFRKLGAIESCAAVASLGLARIAQAREQADEAMILLYAACEHYPAYGKAHYALGLAYKDQNRDAESQRHFRLAQQHRLDEPPLADPWLEQVYGEDYRAVDYLRAGEQALYHERPSKAAAAFEQALALDPHRVEAHAGLIRAYGSLNRIDKAGQHFQEALALDRTSDQLHLHYGVLLLSQHRYEEARQQFRLALEVNPYYAQSLAYTGYLAEQDRQFEDAAAKYREAISHLPGYRAAHLRLAGLLLRGGKPEAAGRQFGLALQKNDLHRPRYLYQAGLLCARSGSKSQAEAYLERASEEAKQHGFHDLKQHIEQRRWPLD